MTEVTLNIRASIINTTLPADRRFVSGARGYEGYQLRRREMAQAIVCATGMGYRAAYRLAKAKRILLGDRLFLWGTIGGGSTGWVTH